MSKQKIIISGIALIILGYGFYLVPVIADTQKPVITYGITSGLAAYKEEMKIFSDGRIDYSLDSEASGDTYFRTANISKEEIDRLIQLFFDNNFASFNDSYGSRVPVFDAPKTIITLNWDKKDFDDSKRWYGLPVIYKQIIIEDTADIPESLEEIEQELSRKIEWFKSLLPKLEFTKGRGDCSLEIGGGSANIELEDSDIVFTGKINTGNPCYNVSANIEAHQDIFNPETGILIISVDSAPSDKICIQCTGSVEYSGKITNLSGMTKYKVIIKTRDAVIVEKEINIPITPIYENKQ